MSPAVYIINLERSLSRRASMQRRLGELGVEALFYSAIDGSQIGLSEMALVDAEKRNAIASYPLTKGEIGCYLSHANLWRHILDGDKSWAVIMEDDLIIDNALPELLDKINGIVMPWDLIRLSGLSQATSIKLVNLDGQYSLNILLNTACGAQAYCLSKQGAKKLLANAFPIIRPVDNALDRYWENDLAILAVQPYPAKHDRKVPSDIDDQGPQRTDFFKERERTVRRLGRYRRKWCDSVSKRWRGLVLLIRYARYRK